MALETASFINGLNTANPQATDSVAQADDHIRLLKSTIKATFPNITGAVTATQEQLGGFVPSGGIIMWSGAVNAVPTGWLLCDGQNSTPDLRDRFVIGAGSNYAAGSSGGSKDAVVVAHTHTASTAGAGGHSHHVVAAGTAVPLTGSNTVRRLAALGDGGIANENFEYDLQGTSDVANAGLTSSVGDHTHSMTVDQAGVSGTDANLPPYYALAFIIKV